MSYIEMGLLYASFGLAFTAFRHSQNLAKRVAELEAAARAATAPSAEAQRA